MDWKTFETSQVITAQERGLLEDYGSQHDLQGRLDIIEEQPKVHVELFMKCVTEIRGAKNYVLALIDQLLQADPTLSRYFHELSTPQRPIYATFQRIMGDPTKDPPQPPYDPVSSDKACSILAVILSTNVPNKPEADEAVSNFINYLTLRLQYARKRRLIQSIQSLKTVLKRKQNQLLFVQREGLLRLQPAFRTDFSNTQLLYTVGFVIWIITFNDDCLPYVKNANVIRDLVAIAKASTREKVVRICFAALSNLLNKSGGKDHAFNEDMIGHGLPRLVATLKTRTWKDKDIEKDLERVHKVLEDAVDELSSFEMYTTEVMSGTLTWSPVHTSTFWKDNINKFEYKNFVLIDRLIASLKESKDETALEVACFDLGEFARFHPDGKRIIERAGGKPILMAMLAHKSPGVKKQALLCIQKLMVQNWQFLSSNKTSVRSAAKAS
eukprot:g16048.t1